MTTTKTKTMRETMMTTGTTTILRPFLVPSAVPASAYCLLAFRGYRTTYPVFIISEPVRRDTKSRRRQQEEENDIDDDDDDEASEPADSILGSESEGEESTEVDGLLDE